MKLFLNATIPTSSAALKRVNVLFDQTIIKISKELIETEEPVETIDLEGKLLLPGAVDIHSHLLGPIQSSSNDLQDATKIALSGGWTTLAEMSYLNEEPIFETSRLESLKALCNEHSYCDLAFWGNVDIDDYPYHSEAAQELWANGVVGLLLMNPSVNDAITDISFTEIMDLFLDIYDSDTSFSYQGYDLKESKQYSSAAQLSAIKKLLRRMQENPIHLPRVVDYDTIEFINGISKRSDISFALNVLDLMHIFSDVKRPDTLPLNLTERLPELLELFRLNKIYILSNHAVLPSQAGSLPGIYSGVDCSLMRYSYLWALSELWKKRKYTLHSCVKMTSENPAKRLGIYPQKGCIDIDSDADFVIYDPNLSTQTDIVTQSGETLELTGAFTSIWIRGEEVSSPNGLIRKGSFVPRTHSPKRRHNNNTWI